MMRAMRIAPSLAALLLVLAPGASAEAQRTLAHDTLTEDTPTAVSCGFCVGEAFGVVFRELPGMGGLQPWQFPVRLSRVQVAMGAATVSGTTCSGVAGGGSTTATIEIFAGDVTPTGDISDLPVSEPWPGETLAYAAESVPITLSAPETAGGAMFSVTLNTFDLADEMGMPIVVPAPATYLRVVVWPDGGGTSSVCDGAGVEAPAGFPLRDADGLIADERSLIYAGGVGWLWNEAAGVTGDWGVRLSLFPLGMRDAGMAMPDAGSGVDAGVMDAGAGLDAGAPPSSAGGCSCRVGADASSPQRAASILLVCALLALRRRTRAAEGVN